jgi:hypothetical protein
MNKPRRCATALILGLLPFSATATDACNPVGTWVVNITSPPESFILPISELVSFLPGGVVLETSSDLAKITGHGAWKRRPNCWIEFKVLKQIFDQTNIDLVGFVRTTAKVKIVGNSYSSEPGNLKSEFVFGLDPDAPPAVSVAVSASTGKRVTAR